MFNTSAFSAVSQWLEQPSDTHNQEAAAEDSSNKPPASSTSSSWRHKRAGLGHETKKVKDKEATAVENSVGTLQKLLAGKGKMSKRQREQEEDDAVAAKGQQQQQDNDDDEDDDGELVGSKARVFAASAKPPAATTIAAITTAPAEGPKKKRRKKKKKGTGNIPEGQDAAGQASAPAENPSHTAAKAVAKEGNPAPAARDPSSHQQKEEQKKKTHQGGTGGGEEEETSEPRRRKRSKTRSKQKNIRRDKRSLDKRPAHLQEGHESFIGRVMTDETRRRLGLPVVAAPAGLEEGK